MFEQSSYNIEPAAEPTQAGDLFHGYELKNWDFGPRLYKIAAIAGAANLLALLVFAQTSLLTMKGCDSPLVSGVCQALDVLDLGQAMLFGSPRDYVDMAYEKTNLKDVDITYVDVSGQTPPLSYPEGYFQIANPEQFQASLENPFDPNSPNYVAPSAIPPGIPITTPNTGGSLIDTTPNYPKKKGNVVGELPGDIDDAAPVNPGKGKGKGKNGDAIANNEKKDPDSAADPQTDAALVNVDPSVINRRPFTDYANKVNALLEKNEVSLDSPFVLKAKGKITKEGRIDTKTWKWVQASSQDPKILEVIKDGIAAIDESNFLTYLSGISGETCEIEVQQDGQNFIISLQSLVKDEYRAKSLKSGLNAAIAFGKVGKGGPGADQNQLDDLMLLDSAKIETAGRKISLKFVLPKDQALKMVQRKLSEQKAAAQKPSGNALVTNGHNTGL